MTREEYELSKAIDRQRAFQHAIQPFLDNAAKLTSYYMPTILVYPDGRVERKDHPKVTEILEQTRQFIQQIASSYAAPEQGEKK